MRQRLHPRTFSDAAKLSVVALAFLLLGLSCARAYAQQDPAAPQPAASHHKFAEFSTGRALPQKGALQASFHNWESEDGSQVLVQREWYKSSGDARNSLGALAKTARVLTQGEKRNAKGDVIGPRLELVFGGANRGRKFLIAWTDRSSLIRISSTSLPLLLDFESQAYP